MGSVLGPVLLRSGAVTKITGTFRKSPLGWFATCTEYPYQGAGTTQAEALGALLAAMSRHLYGSDPHLQYPHNATRYALEIVSEGS